MKKTPVIVIIIGCLLLFTNLSAAATTVVKRSPAQEEVVIAPDLKKDITSLSPAEEEETEKAPIDALEQEEEQLQLPNKIAIKQPYLHEQGQTLAVANAGGPYAGDVGTLISFSGSTAVISPGTTYTWDFGDGATGYGLQPTHTYAAPGRYMVTFTVTKSTGATYIDMAPVYIEIENDHLEPYGKCCYYATVNDPIVFDASLSTSTYPTHPIVSYKWYFGDGTVGYGKKIIHTYTESGPYFVQLEVCDSEGNTRMDVLHADIDCKLETLDDFLIPSSPLVQDIVSFIDKIKKQFLFALLDVKIVTTHNGYQKITSVPDGYSLPQIDVNNDGDYDVNIEDISFFTLEKTYSDFTGRWSLSWKSSFSAKIYEKQPGFEDITESDELSLLLQFTIGQLLTSVLGIEEPVINLGYTSKAGEEKTSEFTIAHHFRPYLLERFWLSGGSQNNNQNAQSSPTGEVIYETLPYGLPAQTENTAMEPVRAPGGTTPLTTGIGSQTISSQPFLITRTQRYVQDTVDADDFYPEQDISVQNIDVNTFSLRVSFANSQNSTAPYYMQTELQLSFDNFVDSTIKSKRFQDVGFEGYDATGDTTLTLMISRQTSSRKATLGVIIDPIENFISHVEHTKQPSGVYTLDWSIDNPPENLVLFTESEDSWGEYSSNYIYIEKIPASLTLELLPKLEDGYISINREGTDECKVGIKNDLEDPTVNFHLTHSSLEGLRLDWELLSQPHTIKLATTTAGLTLHAEMKEITQQDQLITFEATVEESLELDVEWSFVQGYLSVRKSQTAIAFEASYRQNDVNLLITGSFVGNEGNGLTIDFNGFEAQGKIEIDSGRAILLQVSAENTTTGASLSTDVNFKRDGHLLLEWDQEKALHLDSSQALAFTQVILDATNFKLTADEIKLETASEFSLQLGDNRLNIGGGNQLTLSNMTAALGYWSGSLEYATSIGTFEIIIKPYDKYFKVDSANNLEIDAFSMIFDSPANQYDTTFSLGAFELENSGTVLVDFSLASPQTYIHGTNNLDIENLLFTVGNSVDFNLEEFHIGGSGTIHTQLTSQYFIVNANVDFTWNIDVETLQFGDWAINGSFKGSGIMTVQEWTPGSTGEVSFVINSLISHNLEIIHNTLQVELGEMNLSQGSIAFQWDRDQFFKTGHFNIINAGVSGTVSLCKLTYNTAQDPITFELGEFTVQSGNLYMDWNRQTNQKQFHINNGATINLALIKVTWDNDKTLRFGNIGLKPGEFKFTWDDLNNQITVKNGMTGLGPFCTYEDSDRKLSVDLTNLVSDYSKTMTLRWYEDINEKIVGVSLDTDDTDLVDWITFESIKYDTNGATGRRISLGGLRADNFKIMKNADDKIEISGKLCIANRFTYSRLTDLQNDTWDDLNVEWDLQSDLKTITFYSEFDPTIKLLSTKIVGVTLTSELTLTDYLQVKWKLDGTGQKEFHLDTNDSVLSTLSFALVDPNGKGVELVSGGLWADNFFVKWQLWPPQQADIIWSGDDTIGYDTATVYGTVDYGATWIEIWPFASGSQHT